MNIINKKVIVCRGIQGSGKTTWAKQWVNEDPESRIRINQDDMRNMLGKYWVPSREKLVGQINDFILYKAMYFKYDIVIDNMNLNSKTIDRIKYEIDQHNKEIDDLIKYNLDTLNSNEFLYKYEIEYKDFFISLEECIKRDSNRENPIGEEVIRKTYEKYKDIINL